jgi:hypothetical protein
VPAISASAGMRTRLVSRVKNRAAGQAVGGGLAGAAVRDAFDDLVGAEPAQVVADLAAGHVPGIFSELGGEEVPQVAAGEAGGPQREGAAGREERLDAGTRGSACRGRGCRWC